MTYIFSGHPDEMMDAFFHRLKQAQAGGPNADREFRQALICLVGLSDRLAQAGAVETQRLQQFWHDACDALIGFSNNVAVYPQRALILAEGANDDEWYELCMRRSVIQLLIEHCDGIAVGALIDPAGVAALDTELRRVGQEQGPVPEPFVPQGLPDSHWWWRYPHPAGGATT